MGITLRIGIRSGRPNKLKGLEPLIDSASLFVYFFGDRARPAIRELQLTLYRGLADDLEATSVPSDSWTSPEVNAGLRYIEPDAVAGHDTAIIQLALNAPGKAVDAWRDMRVRLEPYMSQLPEEGIWGHTLVYEAPLPPGTDKDKVLESMLPVLRQYLPPNRIASLAQAEIEGGWVWLLAVPLRGVGFPASTVYAALVPTEHERAFVPNVLWGPTAALLLPDLIATKGYFQRRQHLGIAPEGYNLDDRYNEMLATLRNVTARLLTDLGKRIAETDEIDDLARAYGPVAETVPLLRGLHFGIRKQVHNFGRVQERRGNNPVFDYHRQHLDTAEYELELKVADGQDALDAAQSASDLAQVRLDGEKGQRQYRTQVLLALFSAAFAVPQILDRTVAAALLSFFRVPSPYETPTTSGTLLGILTGNHPGDGYPLWSLVLVQLIAIVVVALLVYRLIRHIENRRSY